MLKLADKPSKKLRPVVKLSVTPATWDKLQTIRIVDFIQSGEVRTSAVAIGCMKLAKRQPKKRKNQNGHSTVPE